jgi:hypothetical protein
MPISWLRRLEQILQLEAVPADIPALGQHVIAAAQTLHLSDNRPTRIWRECHNNLCPRKCAQFKLVTRIEPLHRSFDSLNFGSGSCRITIATALLHADQISAALSVTGPNLERDNVAYFK